MYGYTAPRKRSTMYGDVDVAADPINKLNLVVTPPDINTSKLLTITDSTGSQTLSLTGDGDINSLGKLTIGNAETNDAQYSSIAGGNRNTIPISGSTSFIGAGTDNIASNTSTVVAGGDTNVASNSFAAIVGGQNNTVTAGYGFIGGGDLNQVTGYIGCVAGGNQNQVNGTFGCVAGGNQNEISTASAAGSIVGGQGNTIVDSNNGAIGGGFGNRMDNFSNHGTIGGGNTNYLNNVTTSVIAGGANNTISGGCDGASILGGGLNTCTGNYSVASGYLNTCTGTYSVASGYRSKATQTGEQAYACGFFFAQGDCQRSTYWLRITSAAIGTFTYLFDGGGEVSYPAGSTGTCKIMYNSSKNGAFLDCQGGVRRYTFQNFSNTFIDDGSSNGTLGVAIINPPVMVMPSATTLRFTVTTLAASAMRHSICVEVYWMKRV